MAAASEAHVGTNQNCATPMEVCARTSLKSMAAPKHQLSTAVHGSPFMPVKPVPDGYHTVTPYLSVSDAAKLLDFLKRAFDAKVNAMHRPDGKVAHAEVQIGDSKIMVADAHEASQAMPTVLYMYVESVDAMYQRAISAGGTSISQPTTQFYGDRHGGVKDPTGNMWWIATHVEDVPPDELQRRADEHAKQQAGGK
jgi:uncharacterized glyoxalase superfamily protein PhnB